MVESRKGSSFMDLENAADNGASLDELLDIVRSMDDPNDLYNVMDLCAGDSYEDNLLWNTAKTKRDTILSMTDRKGSCGHCERPDNLNTIAQSVVSGMSRKIGEPSRKGAPAFATGNSGKIMNDVKGLINNPTVSTKLQKTFGTQDQRNQAILQEHNNEQAKIDRQNKVDQLRTGGGVDSITTIPEDVRKVIDNSVKIDGIEYDFFSTRTILETMGYTVDEIDDYVDEYMLEEMDKTLQEQENN